MNLRDLETTQSKFNALMPEVIKGREEDYKLRKDFTDHFSASYIKSMDINEYVLGYPLTPDDWNFCYQIEQELDGLGRIIGANAFKFGVYYGRIKSDATVKYRHAKKFGKNYSQAFENVKHAILNLLAAGEKQDLHSIADNPLSNMFKGKILSIYYPERYLNIFSDSHLKYFITALDLDTPGVFEKDVVFQRELLLEFKNSDKLMRRWTVDMFSYFLYRVYPLGPNFKAPEVEAPEFSPYAFLTEVDLDVSEIAPANDKNENNDGRHKDKVDYEKQARLLKLYGDRGEKLVVDFEKKRLEDAGFADLAKKVKRVSLKSDSYGYDVRSFNIDGSKRYIEVKATTVKSGLTELFITANELNFATGECRGNYWVYIVYDIKSETPKVWIAGNIFAPESPHIVKMPVLYKIKINATKHG